MNLDKIISTFSKDVQESPSMKGLVTLIQTLAEQFQKTQEQLQKTQEQLQKTQEQLQKTQELLTKSEVRIKVLEDELAKFRKTPKRPKFHPNKMEPRSRNKPPPPEDNPLTMARALFKKEQLEIKIPISNPPKGSRFKGYQSYSVQEMILGSKETTYKLEVWETPSGEVIRAELPKELKGSHYGPTLKALSVNLYAQGMTQPAIHEFLRGLDIEISTGQVNNILLNEAEYFSKVGESILTAGLNEASYIRTDDTGEKHNYKSAYCTHLGGEHFAYYKTTSSKSRENFLKILLQEKEGYCINDAMIWHLFQAGVKDEILNLFEEYRGKSYRSKKGMKRLLNVLALKGKKLEGQCIEAGLVGFISKTILKPGQILLSDRAGQFSVFDHAECWIHMERPLRKIITTSEQAEKDLKRVREAIWSLYKALRKASETQTGKEEIHQLYDELVVMKTISPEINAVIANFAEYREGMLKALDHPGLPLHNNDSERDIRGVAKRRNISGSTKSILGRKFRDALLTLKQTCFRVRYNFWDYLQLWFMGDPPDLATFVRNKYRSAPA